MSDLYPEGPVERKRKTRHRIQTTSAPIDTLAPSVTLRGHTWKMLLMAAVIAVFEGILLHAEAFVTMEGTLILAYALALSAVWNGGFNAILVFCRDMEKITAGTVGAEALKQAALCLGQSALTIAICWALGVCFSAPGGLLPFLGLELLVTVFLITLSADWLCLLISALMRNAVKALIALPFVLVFHILFSGGIFALPAWMQPVSYLSVSNYGVRCIAAQGSMNELPLTVAWKAMRNMRDKTVGCTVSLGQVLDFISDESNELISSHRQDEIIREITVGDALHLLNIARGKTEDSSSVRQKVVNALHLNKISDTVLNKKIVSAITLGQCLDYLENSSFFDDAQDKTVSFSIRLGDLYDAIGEENVRDFIQGQSAEALKNTAYAHTPKNILTNWAALGGLGACFLMITLFAVWIEQKRAYWT